MDDGFGIGLDGRSAGEEVGGGELVASNLWWGGGGGGGEVGSDSFETGFGAVVRVGHCGQGDPV